MDIISRRLILAFSFSVVCLICNAQYTEIPIRLDSCIELRQQEVKHYLPLWHYLGIVEDIYFIGDAEINESHKISGNKVYWCREGTIEFQNLRRTEVTYSDNVCTAKTLGMRGMYDYEEIYSLIGYPRLDSIKIEYIHEPGMQAHLNKDGHVNKNCKVYNVINENDSVYNADYRYIVCPNHIICGHEEYFFKNGILVRKILHGRSYTYKYLAFDLCGNWILRDEYLDNGEKNRQERVIKYL